jgi:hypothetical protein
MTAQMSKRMIDNILGEYPIFCSESILTQILVDLISLAESSLDSTPAFFTYTHYICLASLACRKKKYIVFSMSP